MTTGNLKGDIINGAYSKLRISGITLQPSPEDNELAGRVLEGMASEFYERNICTGYNFEDEPDPGSVTNIKRAYWDSYEWLLAFRLLPNFGKEATAALKLSVDQASSFLYSSTAQVQETNYPSRHPVGSGNSLHRSRYRRYYPQTVEAPTSCATKKMVVDDTSNFVEHFDSYLNESEDIASYTIEADTGLTIVSDSNATPDINYEINAAGNNGTKSDQLLRVKIVITTTDSRIQTRLIYFELITIEIS